jgi:hypothetical protein
VILTKPAEIASKVIMHRLVRIKSIYLTGFYDIDISLCFYLFWSNSSSFLFNRDGIKKAITIPEKQTIEPKYTKVYLYPANL